MTYLATGKRTLTAIGVALSISLATAACQTNQQTGTIVGGGLGAGLGAMIGERAGNPVIGAIVGGVAGSLIGSEIGRYLDEADRKRAAETTVQAVTESRAQGGKPVSQTWQSEENPGVAGMSTAAANTQAGADCYDVREVATIPGQGDVSQTSTVCYRDGQLVSA